MTHKLHLETTDSSRNKGLALAVNEQEELEYDEEEAAMLVQRLKIFFRNSRYANQRNNKDKRSANSKSDYECHNRRSTDHFIKDCPTWKNDKGKGNWKTTDERKSQQN